MKIAFRHLRKNKLYTFVNLSGLTIGIASCLLIGIYIAHELSYDRFHKNANRLARVTMDFNFGDAVNKIPITGTKVGPQFKRTFPGIEAYVRTYKSTRVVSYKEKSFEEKKLLYADSAFFKMFSFYLVSGNQVTALDAPDKIVVTQSMAKKYFGTEEPIGKILRVGENKNFIVSAVAADAPGNSQIQFDFVASFTSLNAAKKENWWEANYITYLLLNPQTKIKTLEKGITAYMHNVNKEELKMEDNHYLTFHLEPITKVHLYSELGGFEPNNSITYIYVLAIVALLILCIACVNYTNLATAQSILRTGEIGVRKVLGAQRFQVFKQFIGESVFITTIALILALATANLLLPLFNRLAGKEISAEAFFYPTSLIILATTGLVVSIAAGFYPAVMVSNLKIIAVLKSGFSFGTGNNRLRKSLIVVQFVISIFLIASTIIVLQQLSYIRNKDLGYDKEHIVVLPLDNIMRPGYDDLKKAILQQKNIKNVSAAYEEPTDIGWSDGISTGEGTDNHGITVNAIPVDEDFIKTMGIRIIAGSDYSQTDLQQFDTSNNDKNLRYSFMLNESAMKALGWTPGQAIDKIISKGTPGVVKAIVKDFHFKSFHHPITPLAIFLDKRQTQKIFVKVSDDHVSSTLDQLGKLWKERVPHRPFEYHFLDDDYESLYKTEQRTAAIFSTFSSLAIMLACLGLFGLTAYAIVQRTKEIGIRKVLGADITNIISLLAKDFLVLIFIAIGIASPLASLATHKWLQDFSYRINIEWWVFVIAGATVLLIALITISFQAIKAALMNPVKSLRVE